MKINVSFYDFDGRCFGRYALEINKKLNFDEQVEHVKRVRDERQLPKIGKKAGDLFIIAVREGSLIRVIMPEGFHGRQKTG